MTDLDERKLRQIVKLAEDLLAQRGTEQAFGFDVRSYACIGGPQQDLNFKFDATFHRLFKLIAIELGVSMKELLLRMAQCWIDHAIDDEQDGRLKALLERRSTNSIE